MFRVVCLFSALLCACASPPAVSSSAEDAATAGTDATNDVAADAADAADSVDVAEGPWDPSATWPNVLAGPVKGALSAGIAQRSLDGPVGVSMGGYGGRLGGAKTPWNDALNGSRGFYGLMTAKAMVLEVGKERLVLLKSPLLTSESYLTDAIARVLHDKYALDLRGRVLMSAGHSHHATARFWPIPPLMSSVGLDSFDPEVTERIANFFAETVKAAVDNLAPAEWAYGTFEDWDADDQVYRDRRDENNPTYGKDPRLTLLAVRKKGGPILASILNFPIHGTAFGSDNDLLTEDAPGIVEHKVEELFFAQTGQPLQAMFMQCAGGDAAPAGDGLYHPTPSRLERLGEHAALKIVPKIQALQWQGEMELAVRTIRRDFDFAHMYAYPELAHEFALDDGTNYLWGGWQCKADNVADGQSMAGHPKHCIDLSTFLPAMGGTLPYGELNQVIVSAARIGDLALITLPGEPTYSLVKYARGLVEGKTPGISKLMVLGYSQDYFLYLTAPDDWMMGGYEAQMSLWGPAGGRFFADTSLQLLRDLLAGNGQPTWWEASPTLSQPIPVTYRAVEASTDANAIVADVPADVSRGQAMDFVFGAGDPALGAPLVTLEHLDGTAWQPLPAKNGHVDAHYDNTRYEMLTIFEPNPPITPEILPQRQHHWRVRWQVPVDWALGQYRLHATAKARVEGKDLLVDVTSQKFHVSAGVTTVQAKRTDQIVVLTATAQAIPYADELGRTWPWSGWRLVNRDFVPMVTAPVRTPIQWKPLAGQPGVLPWDEKAGGAVLDLSAHPELPKPPLTIWVELPGSDTLTALQIP